MGIIRMCSGKGNKNLHRGFQASKRKHIMKKTIAILLVLVLAGFGLFATVAPVAEEAKKPATIKVLSTVNNFSAFGVTTEKISYTEFVSIDKFLKAVDTSIETTVDMLALDNEVSIGFLSGVNNTKNKVSLYISTTDLASSSDRVGIRVTPNYTSIPSSAEDKFGSLRNTELFVKEVRAGAAAYAPAGSYSATITIALTSS